jgi:hypothetical protein
MYAGDMENRLSSSPTRDLRTGWPMAVTLDGTARLGDAKDRLWGT